MDVTIQAQILELIKKLQKEYGTTVILITHDLGIVAGMADEIVVMYAGEIVEQGPCRRYILSSAASIYAKSFESGSLSE